MVGIHSTWQALGLATTAEGLMIDTHRKQEAAHVCGLVQRRTVSLSYLVRTRFEDRGFMGSTLNDDLPSLSVVS